MEQELETSSPRPDVLGTMYKDYFLDYASYVILERAIPAVEDGLKPVQRRILHAMFQMHDERYHKVANIIGQTMQYHPHGDASIGDALVNLGQKDLLIDCQGNWGDARTGDPAAASRYIEARLTKFALDVVFNPRITNWQWSYDGRKKEPITLPVKFPLLLMQGVEGIAVGLSTKILPHNFSELIKASIDLLKGKSVEIYPDFPTGGSMDLGNYDCNKRGGKIKVRAKIEIVDRKTLIIREIPYGTTTESLIESIKKANDKNKLKIKSITDKTAEFVEILIDLPPASSPEQTLDALYAFTDCELSLSPNLCIIEGQKPLFLSAIDLLRRSTAHTKELLRQELLWREQDLERKWHHASLEKIFIEHKIYQKIEECKTWEAIVEAIEAGLEPHIKHLRQPVTEDDIRSLTEIRIKRISRFDQDKANRLLKEIEDELEEVRQNLADLVNYAIEYFKRLLKDYGKNAPARRTEIQTFEAIEAAQVVLNTEKLYVNRADGFIGYGLKKDEFIEECSTLDDVIVFHSDGTYSVSKIAEKTFIGKDPLHVAIWRKQGVDRLIYNVIYADLGKNLNYVKRFAVTAITRDKKYPIATGVEKSKILYFSANLNGEAETVKVQLTRSCTAKNKEFTYDFAELEVKGRSARGNLLSKYPIRKISFKAAGESTLDQLKLYLDEATGRLSHQAPEQGICFGPIDEETRLLPIYQDGSYEMTSSDLSNRFEMKDLLRINRYDAKTIYSILYYDGERKATYAKRFQIDTTTLNQRFSFLPNDKAQLLLLSTEEKITFHYRVKVGTTNIDNKMQMQTLEIATRQALGNKVWDGKPSKFWDEVEDPNEGPKLFD